MVKLILIATLLCSLHVEYGTNADSITISSLKGNAFDSTCETNIKYSYESSNELLNSSNQTFSMIHSNLKTNKIPTENYSISSNNSISFINGCYSKTVWDLKSSNPRRNDSSADNRKNVNYLSNYLPLSSVGFFNARATYSTVSVSTCFLIGNGLALTAAHCLYSDSTGYYYDITAQFDKNVKTGNFGTTAKVTDFYIPKAYTEDTQSDEDWAILKFETDLTKTLGCLTIASNQSLSNTEYTSVGFPYDKGEGNYYESTGYSYITTTDKYYDMYSYATSGMSGGSVIAYYSQHDERDPNVDLTYEYVVGINSKAFSYTSSNVYHQYTRATRIQNSIIEICKSIGGK